MVHGQAGDAVNAGLDVVTGGAEVGDPAGVLERDRRQRPVADRAAVQQASGRDCSGWFECRVALRGPHCAPSRS